MPQVWRVRVGRDPQNRLPAIQLKINNLYEVTAVLSTGDPTTCIAEPFAEDLLRVENLPLGRRVIPSDVGRVIARTLRLRRLTIVTAAGGPLEFAPWTVAVSTRPRMLGVGVLLGTDVLGTFQRLTYEFDQQPGNRAPRDTLILKRDT